MKNHLHELSGSIRDLAKTVLGGNFTPPPVAGIRVKSMTVNYNGIVNDIELYAIPKR